MRSSDFDATHLVKGVKGLALSEAAFSHVLIDGRTIRITNANKDRAIEWFAQWAAQKLEELPGSPKILVPIPGSATTIDSAPDFRTALIAEKIAARMRTARAFPWLRFNAARPNSRQGGSRDPEVLYRAMRLRRNIPEGEIILIDDVLTSGGHLKAASWKFADADREIRFAVCCGRTCEAQLENPFDVIPEDIDLQRQPI
jgi:hypothetical protein